MNSATDVAAPRTAAVVGASRWGATLATLLASNGVPTTLLARSVEAAERLERDRSLGERLPELRFPHGLRVSAAPGAATADLVVFAVPSEALGGVAAALAEAVPPGSTVLSAAKGIEPTRGRRMSELLAEALPGRPLAALSGPNLAREIAAGLPGTTVIASADAPLEQLRAAFHSRAFRVYTSHDIVGVELGGALKNVIAIAAGMVDAFGYGDNAKSALVTRGLAEIARLGIAAGAYPITFQGLAGMGDLVATSYSPLSRNRRLGELLARGHTLPAALAEIGETVEGARTVPAALRLGEALGVELPIAGGLHGILYEGVPPVEAVQALLDRDPKPELG